MNENSDAREENDDDDEGPPSRIPLIVTGVTAVALVVCYFSGQLWLLPGLILQVVMISLVIWQACDPFADAAQWIGTELRVPGSVRGATLDAIASSMPELFSGIFFVVVAVTNAGEGSEALAKAAGEGYGSALATCAGSAIYNMILIPAFCALVISYYRPKQPTIDIEPEVVMRDGLWFMGCEMVLIFFLFQNQIDWWAGVIFLVLYAAYIMHLVRDAQLHRVAHHAVEEYLDEKGHQTPAETVVADMKERGISASEAMVERVRIGEDDVDDEEDLPDSAGVLFGFAEIPLNHVSAWAIIAVCTAIAASACYWLVEVTNETGEVLNVPVFFVAVILAAAASSVPDTFLSIGSSMRGDDDGAVSNAFGSNIFDICICLSIPLLVNSYLNDWNTVYMTDNGQIDGEPLAGLVGLRFLLFILSGITLAIIWHKRQLTRTKAFILCGLYALFIAYAVAGSLGYLQGLERFLNGLSGGGG